MAKKPAMQGGGPNYLGKQKEVKAPLRWKSSPNHPEAHLAYITDAEQDLLIKQNMHGGLEDGKPNKGPYGIPSLQGDLGGYDASPSGPDSGGGAGGKGSEARDKQRAADIMTGRVNVSSPTGVTEGYTGDRGVQRGGIGDFVGQRYTGKGLFGLGSGYRDVYTKGPRQGQVRPGYLGRILGGIGSFITGVPFVGSALGTAYDYGKGLFGLKDPYADMSAYNELGLFGEMPEDFEDEKISETSFTANDPNNINNQQGILATNRFTDSRTNFGLGDMDGS